MASGPSDEAQQQQQQLGLRQQLEELQKNLGKKQHFEAAVKSISSLVQQHYASASPPLRTSMFQAITRVSTVLQSRYVAPYFWKTGLNLFEEAEQIVTEKVQKENIKKYIAKAREFLQENDSDAPAPPTRPPDNRYLFEGHLTVQQEPPPPAWLVAQQTAMSLEASLGESSNSEESEEFRERLMSQLVTALNQVQESGDLESIMEATFLDGSTVPKKPPASKEVVANLPVVDLNEEILEKLGTESECAVCRENLVVGDKMQELPCKHLFHPPCLKPWLDEHNSCPICRHELRTDDHAYESRKEREEREKEEEEERRGAANAVRGGEFMYI